MRQWIKKWLLGRDIILSRPPGQFTISHAKLPRLKERGLKVGFTIDGGAATGLWARDFKAVYPDSEVLCVEPREDAQIALRALQQSVSGIHLAPTLLGDREGITEFHVSDDQSSIF